MRFGGYLVFSVLAFLIAFGGVAQADTITAKYEAYTGANGTYTIGGYSYSGGGGLFTFLLTDNDKDGNGTAGIPYRVDGDVFGGFCIEVTQHLNSGDVEYTVIDPQDGPRTNSVLFGNMGADGQAALSDIFGSSYYKGPRLSDWTAQEAYNFQLAVWEIVYEYERYERLGLSGAPTLDATSGHFSYVSANGDSSIVNQILALVGNTGTQGAELVAISRDNDQDFVIVVPLPSAGIAGGLLLLCGFGVAGARRKSRRRRA